MISWDESPYSFAVALNIRPISAAIACLFRNPAFIIHIAQLYERSGMKEQALKLADPLLARPSEMSPDDYEELRSLIRKLRSAQS